MTTDSNTSDLTTLISRARTGDPAARNDLIRAAHNRLEVLARRMLRRYPAVRRWADTGDVFQGAAVRLLRALEATAVGDTRGFFNLAAAVIRRELIDLVRHFQGPRGIGANHASHPPREGGPQAPDRPDPGPDPTDLDRWTALHEAIGALPPEEREVFGLTYYHDWTQEQVAELFDIHVRTVRRRWRRAAALLYTALGGQLPE